MYYTYLVKYVVFFVRVPSLNSMGTDWNQVMAQYGSYLSEDDATQFQNTAFAPTPEIPAQGSPAPPSSEEASSTHKASQFHV